MSTNTSTSQTSENNEQDVNNINTSTEPSLSKDPSETQVDKDDAEDKTSMGDAKAQAISPSDVRGGEVEWPEPDGQSRGIPTHPSATSSTMGSQVRRPKRIGETPKRTDET